MSMIFLSFAVSFQLLSQKTLNLTLNPDCYNVGILGSRIPSSPPSLLTHIPPTPTTQPRTPPHPPLSRSDDGIGRRKVTKLATIPHVPVLIVPVNKVDLHGVHLTIHRVLRALPGVRAPVPVKLQEVEPGRHSQITLDYVG